MPTDPTPTPADHARARGLANDLLAIGVALDGLSIKARKDVLKHRDMCADDIARHFAITRAEALEAAATVAETAEEWAQGQGSYGGPASCEYDCAYIIAARLRALATGGGA